MLIQRKSILQSLLSSFGLGLFLLMIIFNMNIVSATNRTDQTSELFLKAIDYGDLDTAQSLLNSGADINYTLGGTTHALALAVNWHRGTKYTTPEIVQFLLSRGANINARYGHEKNDKSGNKTPIMRAIQSDYSSNQIRLMYIANGADIHAEDSFGNSVLAHAVVHLHYTQSADGTTGKQFIAHLLSLGADPNHKNRFGATPFLLLVNALPSESANVKSEYLALVKYMVQKGADPNIAASNGLKPIDIAFQRNNIPVYQYLLAVENGTAPKGEPASAKPIQKSKAPVVAKTSMARSELSIGGIAIGQTMDYVVQVYGKPGVIDDQGFFQIYNYNDLFVVTGQLNNGYKVSSVASYEKEVATPSGFRVGMPFSEVIKKYGEVKSVKFKAEGLEKKLKGCKDYTYFCEDAQMVFLVDKNQVIQAIRLEPLDQEKYKAALSVR
ncbi:hypothetical protein II906_07975 [bacterium]|nr:hypothetical protein [bacterium]